MLRKPINILLLLNQKIDLKNFPIYYNNTFRYTHIIQNYVPCINN